jgi:TIR domain
LPHKPAAFFSYVHFDDQTDGGRLTEFRKRLSAEVRVQTGEEFPIFQDKDLKWGENWKKRIDESLDSTTFFIPIITPSFFNSQPCLDELERFLEREKKLGREELVLPVYYVDTPLINQQPEGSTRKEKLAQVIASRQYFDWRELRFEPITSALISKTIAQLASHIRDAVQRAQTPAKPEETAGKKRSGSHIAPSSIPAESQSGGTAAASTSEQLAPSVVISTKSTSKTEPPTRTVDPMHRGDYTTITAAVQAANPGDRILVRPGLYEEGIIIDKPLEIVGDASPGEVVMRTADKHVILW